MIPVIRRFYGWGGRMPAVLVLGAWLLGAPPAASQVATNGEIDGLEARFVDVNGVRTRYYEYGRGEPVVMIHGGMIGGSSTANNWSRNIPGLAKHFRVLALDRLAQGMTDNPRDDADFTNEATARHVYEFIQTMKLAPVHLVGHSAGGGIAFYVALEHPEVVRTLTVVSAGPQMPPAGPGPTKFDAILRKCPPDTASYEHLRCRLLALGHTPETFPPEYDKADQMMGNLPKSVEGRKRMAAMRERQPGWPATQNNTYRDAALQKARDRGLRMPILIFAGKQDTLSWDASDSHAMMRRELGFFEVVGARNTAVKLVIINEAGHFPYREHPELFNAELIHFIGQSPASGGQRSADPPTQR
jgi:2-hydroxy-6-oxonona-2,4-dienedioate hydrolase